MNYSAKSKLQGLHPKLVASREKCLDFVFFVLDMFTAVLKYILSEQVLLTKNP